MEWNVVTIEETSGNNVAFVSIGRGQLDFNAIACDLVGDVGQYKFVKLLTGRENGKTIVGVKFLCEAEPDTLPIKRKSQKGKTIKGMNVANKGVIEKLFGKDGANNGMVRHKVALADDPNILKIY